MSKLFKDRDDDFQILDELLENLDDDTVEALVRTINGSGDSFLEIAIENNNEEALIWMHEYFIEGGSNDYNISCSNNDECIFDKYCRMADSLGSSDRRDLLDANSNFESFLEDEVDISSVSGNSDYGTFCEAVTTSIYSYRVKSWALEVEDEIDEDDDYLILEQYP